MIVPPIASALGNVKALMHSIIYTFWLWLVGGPGHYVVTPTRVEVGCDNIHSGLSPIVTRPAAQQQYRVSWGGVGGGPGHYVVTPT